MNAVMRPSGLLVIETEAERQERDRNARMAAYKAYDEAHSRCPVCNGDSITMTTAGMMVDPRDTGFRDTNRAYCRCGWVGIVHDLVP